MLQSLQRRLKYACILLMALGVGACDSGTDPDDSNVVESVEVSAQTSTAKSLGESVQFSAIARNKAGELIHQKSEFTWTSSDEAVATVVAETGAATAVANGTATITATIDGISGTAQLTVEQAPAKIAFAQAPTVTTAGEPLAVAVEIQDARDNRVTTASSEVTLALATNTTGATLSGTHTVAATAGLATFSDVSIDKVGTGYTLAASVGDLAATSSAFEIRTAAAAKLAFVVSPDDQVAGATLAPAVKVEIVDRFGNRITDAVDPVTVAIPDLPAGGTLAGTATVAAIDGLATFVDLSTEKAGIDYTLTAASGSLESATSEPFTIRPDAPARLAYRVAPATMEGNEPIPLEVEVQDRFGNTAYNATQRSITVELGNNPTGTGILGTLVADTDAGVAIFADVRIPAPGAGYTLVVSSDALPESASAEFGIHLTFVAISQGAEHTCGLTVPGHAYCWGANDVGQLGIGEVVAPPTESAAPRLVTGGHRFASLTVGHDFACGLTAEKTAYCWGSNQGGQLGADRDIVAFPSSPGPVAVAAPAGLQFDELAAGAMHACGRTASGETHCWGSNARGQLGIVGGAGAPATRPQPVAGGHSFDALTAGGEHTCGLKAADGAVFCWGWNAWGQTGTGSLDGVLSVPTRVAGTEVFVAIAAGDLHTCGITEAGSASCWGNNEFGQLGNDQNGQTRSKTNHVHTSQHCHVHFITCLDWHTHYTNHAHYGEWADRHTDVPSPVAGEHVFAELAVRGGDHTCAITDAGAVLCWGDHNQGQLGIGLIGPCGTSTDVYIAPGICADVPTPVVGERAFALVSAGARHTCAIDPSADAGVYCWGRNERGQLGTGTPGGTFSEPQRVIQD